MPNRMLLPGYRAVLLGSAASIQGLSTVAPLEEGTAEGALMLMRLDFTGYPSGEALNELEGKFKDADVPPWPGYGHIVYAEISSPAPVPSVYLAWQKGIAWMPIIIGILVTTLLPTRLGGFVWWLLPEPIKSLITMMVNVGVMILMITVVSKIISGKEPKRIKEAA